MIGFFALGEDGGKLKVDQAEAPVGLAVGDVAHFGVVVAHAVGPELGVEFAPALFVEMVHPAAAIGGNDPKLRGIGFEQSGHEWTPAGFEMAKDPHLVVEPLPGLGAAKNLVHTAIVTDPDEGPQSVFRFLHDMGNMARSQEKGASFSFSCGAFFTACEAGMISAFIS